jgi:hypothetical protein
MASDVGIRRYTESLRNCLIDKHGASTGGYDLHIAGACGELAFAKRTGRYWSGSVNTFKSGGDVGLIQVRTRSSDDYELLIREDDEDECAFVLVTGRVPDFTVHGYMFAEHAKRQEWQRKYGGREAAFFVPTDELYPIADLVVE